MNSMETPVGKKAETTEPRGCYCSHELVRLQKNNYQPLKSLSKMSSKSSTYHMLSLAMKMLTNTEVLLEWREENMLQPTAAEQVIKHSCEPDLKLDLAIRKRISYNSLF